MLDKLLEELGELQEARSLLEQVYHHVSPYGNRPVGAELLRKLNAFFKFDDSE